MTDESLSLNKYGINLSGGTADQPQLCIKEINESLASFDNLKVNDQVVGINEISMAGYTWDEAMYMIQDSKSEVELTIQRKIILRAGEGRRPQVTAVTRNCSNEYCEQQKVQRKKSQNDHGNGHGNGQRPAPSQAAQHKLKVKEVQDRGDAFSSGVNSDQLSNGSASGSNSAGSDALDREVQLAERPVEGQALSNKQEPAHVVREATPQAQMQTPQNTQINPNKRSFKFAPSNTEKCTKCTKTVYHAERCIGPSKNIYHKMCLSCTLCRTNLSTGNWSDHDKLPYCKSCYNKNFGVHGTKR